MLFKKAEMALATVVALGLGGCAFVPEVTLNYYYPKAQTKLTVTQSLACSPDKKLLISSAVVSDPTTIYTANMDGGTASFDYKALSRYLADTDSTVTLTSDGALSGINSTSTGVAGTTLKNVISLVGAVRTIAATIKSPDFVSGTTDSKACTAIAAYRDAQKTAAAPVPPPAPAVPGPAKAVKPAKAPMAAGAGKVGGMGGGAPTDETAKNTPKAVSFTYEITLNYGALESNTFTMTPDSLAVKKAIEAGNDDLFATPYPKLFEFKAIVTKESEKLSSATKSKASCEAGWRSSTVPVTLNYFKADTITVQGPNEDFSNMVTMSDFALEVPVAVPKKYDPKTLVDVYCVPVPRAGWFGKVTFALALSPSGSIQKLQYARSSASSDLTDAAANLAKAIAGPSDADKATAIKAQADVIAQTQRLAACKADPTTCK